MKSMWSRILVDLDSVSIHWSFLHLFESESVVVKSGPTLCDPMDCSLPGSSVQGIFQARILEWVAISFSRGSSQPRDRTQVSHIASRCFIILATREELLLALLGRKPIIKL